MIGATAAAASFAGAPFPAAPATVSVPADGLLGPALFAAFAAWFVVTAFGVAYWVYGDAKSREISSPLWWAAFVVWFPPAAAYYFLFLRRTHERSTEDRSGMTWRWAVVASSLLGFAYAAVGAPPDPFTTVAYAALGVLVLVLPVYVIGDLVLRPRAHGGA